MSDNLYERLSLSNDASASDIKKAYHRLSLKHHPDRNNNSDESTKLFQNIGEAYDTLGDSTKKRQYDLSQSLGMGQDAMPQFADMEELFTNLFGMGGGMGSAMGGGMNAFPFRGMPPGDTPGGKMNFAMFHNGVPVNMNMGSTKPTAITKRLEIDIDLVLIGGKVPVEYERWVLEGGVKRTETTKIYVDIIQGIDNNETIVVKDVGNIIHDNCMGDLKVIIQVRNDSEYIRNGLDLVVDKTISLKDALCGFSFELKYLNGKTYTITNKEGSIVVPDFTKLIPNMGLQRGEARGHLMIRFQIEFPTSLDSEVIQKLKDLL
jgi:DnaJ family protein A protein 2